MQIYPECACLSNILLHRVELLLKHEKTLYILKYTIHKIFRPSLDHYLSIPQVDSLSISICSQFDVEKPWGHCVENDQKNHGAISTSTLQ